ncbi:MAG: hypothetical protein KAY65_03810 [Planctomycetes bacterium]|nr:hypothetical protein [Planctomycetota bacterium]
MSGPTDGSSQSNSRTTKDALTSLLRTRSGPPKATVWEAIKKRSLEKALDIARSAGNEHLARQITEQIELCKRNKPPNSPPHKSDGK